MTSFGMVINNKINFTEFCIYLCVLILLLVNEGKIEKLYDYFSHKIKISNLLASYILGAVYGALFWKLLNYGLANGSAIYFRIIKDMVESFFENQKLDASLLLTCAYIVCGISIVFAIAIIAESIRDIFSIERFIPYGTVKENIKYWHAVNPGEILYYDDFEKLSIKIFRRRRLSLRISRVLNIFGGRIIIGGRIYLHYAFTPLTVFISLIITSLGLWEELPNYSRKTINDFIKSVCENLISLNLSSWGSIASILTAGLVVLGVALAYLNKTSIISGVRESRFTQAAEALAKIELNYLEICKNHEHPYLSALVMNLYKSYDLLESACIPNSYKSTGFNFCQKHEKTIFYGNSMIVLDSYPEIEKTILNLDRIYDDTPNKSSLWNLRVFFIEKNLNAGIIEYSRILSGFRSFAQHFPDARFSEERYKFISKNINSRNSDSYYFKKYRDFIEDCEAEVLEVFIVMLEIRNALYEIEKSLRESKIEKILKSVKGGQ